MGGSAALVNGLTVMVPSALMTVASRLLSHGELALPGRHSQLVSPVYCSLVNPAYGSATPAPVVAVSAAPPEPVVALSPDDELEHAAAPTETMTTNANVSSFPRWRMDGP